MPTEPFEPTDAIIPIRPGLSVVDPVYYLVGLLRTEWEANHTDGIVPIIEFAELNKGFQFGNKGDYISIYTTSVTTTPVTITYGWQNEDHNFTLDCFTSGDRSHLAKMVEEARRILHKHREDTFGNPNGVSGRQWLKWGVRMNSFDRINKLFYRRAIDCVLHWKFRQITE